MAGNTISKHWSYGGYNKECESCHACRSEVEGHVRVWQVDDKDIEQEVGRLNVSKEALQAWAGLCALLCFPFPA